MPPHCCGSRCLHRGSRIQKSQWPAAPRAQEFFQLRLPQDGKKMGYDTEAFAIYDTMQYVKPPIHTICVGTAWGEAAMLLASGAKVCVVEC